MKKTLMAVALATCATAYAYTAPARDVRVFVDGAECRSLKAMGKAVSRPHGSATLFTAGGSFANRWLTDASVGPGNFLVKARLSIDNPIFCDASIRVGGVIMQPVGFAENADSINGVIADILGKAGIPVVLIDYDILPPPARSSPKGRSTCAWTSWWT